MSKEKNIWRKEEETTIHQIVLLVLPNALVVIADSMEFESANDVVGVNFTAEGRRAQFQSMPLKKVRV
jgi:hypothetical protein